MPSIRVDVVYAQPDRAAQTSVELSSNSTVGEALSLAARNPAFDQIDLINAVVGIFGRVVRLEEIVNDGDRIEIYRQVTADPKADRRARAKRASRSVRS
jgi:uncharacterized protein